ncbi:DUF481 domain-containing protein [Gilvimarinus xylanilyticus]|uniref:DUF481 domain-containing protein n=1 Tax=Gilvimarinus xylanilyticus TaxID=2944139 RepID=A0A9X2HUP3_9GAMM|nr:DUF481 domain-containing protein [Gilvimarinus xylanilyticus]MCP8897979.1 DUF481 domain-containing protein [Gilvimarinus xylanilyticus]
MKTFVTSTAAAVLLVSAGIVQAQDDDVTEVKTWEVAAELGAISTSGNTETMSVNGKVDLTQTLEHWKNEFVASVLYKEDEIKNDSGIKVTETTAEKYFGSAKSSYLFADDFSSLFGFASHTHDEFGSYRDYTVVSFGYGARFIDNGSITLDGEIVPGYYWGDKVLDEETDTIESEEGAMVRVAGELNWEITENATFNQKLAAEAAEDNTRYLSDTSLSTKISDRMQMKVGYTLSHDTDVAPDKEETDTTTYINLVYNF